MTSPIGIAVMLIIIGISADPLMGDNSLSPNDAIGWLLNASVATWRGFLYLPRLSFTIPRRVGLLMHSLAGSVLPI
jgi:hypothetical protein